ncbi:ABC transporter ATP-binding protein [Streptococcus pseudoporcinus]|uniref:Di-tripeptide transporter ATP-binding protein n=3 Tax=Streptococcus pseudoporcinus TaxID=361101 RepID=A0A4U9YDU9_9STRE|nr:ATP-binding cassette domain-containing protein [Streptococcus pseudoporcinus]VTS23591.1 di-tripeptide transporter ATP-binding protein [Streptococcus pseudoporcinus]VUC70726.1 di-tripeptide transporter ATP-binding protein [Streptococcus pseudoporcinus]VUD00473.1 di-tripeptide transporter ATP-binding protein [Streptococcus pseudoporcinus]VUD00848.1 di-tripeptide transporter ATP-binding protein [Streptococcus pseudoporcinus]
MTEERKKLVELKDVSLIFNKGKKNEVKAIDNISFDIYEGEVFGLVGESGSGKTTVGRAILKLYDINEGDIIFNGKTISNLKGKDLHEFRKDAQMIFQDPQASLNGRMKIRDIVAEGLDIHKLSPNKAEREERVQELLERVGLNRDHVTRYPHEFSGGQRQRIGIARALAVKPKFIIADEPISALDVSIQAQVVNLMQRLQEERGLTYLFIAHDLSMVKYISDRIGVMHWGKMLEIGTSDDVYNNPIHPYTRSLLSAIPEPDPDIERQRVAEIYDPSIEMDGQERRMHEITPGHFVLSTEAEAEAYRAQQRK